MDAHALADLILWLDEDPRTYGAPTRAIGCTASSAVPVKLAYKKDKRLGHILYRVGEKASDRTIWYAGNGAATLGGSDIRGFRCTDFWTAYGT
ncbi:MAG: hypothetical protein LBT21_06220 [Oscillospiraceae bacterium]|nr:hypothetical protein [Oscillospiraceae bacterium]